MAIEWNPREARWEGEDERWDKPLSGLPVPRFAPGDVIRKKPDLVPVYQTFVQRIFFDPFWYDYHKRSDKVDDLRAGIKYVGSLAFAHSDETSDYYLTRDGGGLVPPDEVEPRHQKHQAEWRMKFTLP